MKTENSLSKRILRVFYWFLLSLLLTIIFIISNRNSQYQIPINTSIAALVVFFMTRRNIRKGLKPILYFEFMILLPYLLIIIYPMIQAMLECHRYDHEFNLITTLLAGVFGWWVARKDQILEYYLTVLILPITLYSLLGWFVINPYLLDVSNNADPAIKGIAKKGYAFPKFKKAFGSDSVNLTGNSGDSLIIVETWFKGCGSCHDEMKALSERIEKLNALPVHLYFVNATDSFVDKDQLPYYIKTLINHPKITFLSDYKTEFFIKSFNGFNVSPSNFIFDPKGRLLDAGCFSSRTNSFNYNLFYRIGRFLKN